jgi:hypothetical protein
MRGSDVPICLRPRSSCEQPGPVTLPAIFPATKRKGGCLSWQKNLRRRRFSWRRYGQSLPAPRGPEPCHEAKRPPLLGAASPAPPQPTTSAACASATARVSAPSSACSSISKLRRSSSARARYVSSACWARSARALARSHSPADTTSCASA